MIAIKYTFFAIISTVFNLLFQYLSFLVYSDFASLYIAMFIGTLAGLVCKYILDKKFIFYHKPKDKTDDAKKFVRYTIMGILTTIIFWGTEIGFEKFFEDENAKYLGAVIGLSIGYVIKYFLDKKYVFINEQPSKSQFQHKDFVITVSFLLLITSISLLISLNLTQGSFTYALNGAYTHMATVENFSQQMSWDYASESPSPLWIFLLSPLLLLFGSTIFTYIPLLLNVLFQIASLWIIFKIIEKNTHQKLHYILGISIILISPFIVLSLGGMENSLQILLVLALINSFLSFINNDEPQNNKILILLLSPFLVLVRYESFALISAFILVLLFYFKNWKFAFSLLFSSLSLIIIFGLWNKLLLNLGFMPSSVSAHSHIATEVSFFDHLKLVVHKLSGGLNQAYIAALYLCNALIVFYSYLKNNKTIFLLSSVFLITFFIHLSLASLGGMFRYEAYLIVFGLLNIFLFILTYVERKQWLILFLILPLFFSRIYDSHTIAIEGSENIYHQQKKLAD